MNRKDILEDKRMADLFAAIAESQNKDLRLCKTLLAGFKATKEKDTGYMDGFMDRLLDFMGGYYPVRSSP